MKRMLYMMVFLAVVAGLSGATLSFVYQATDPVIQANQLKDELASLKALYPNVSDFKVKAENVSDSLQKVYQSKSVTVCKLKVSGYKDGTVFLVGIKDGKVDKYSVISNGDTKGIGSRVADKAFKDQIEAGKLDTISGATISSKPVIEGIKEALAYVQKGE